ncbi:MAG TPA: hypothetical protein VKC53_04330 [Patescibacteria group bacterium]|nr:hypothetical protein [Patescibacteria group bacterium]
MTKEMAGLAQKHLNGFNLAKGDIGEQGAFLRASLTDDELCINATLLVADPDAFNLLINDFAEKHPKKLKAEHDMDKIRSRIARQINLARENAINGSISL